MSFSLLYLIFLHLCKILRCKIVRFFVENKGGTIFFMQNNKLENSLKFIEKAIENQDDFTTGFMARSLVQATMPHSKPKENYYHRENGDYSLVMYGHPKYGIPYGTIPRLLMSWITTEVVRKQNKEIELGHSLHDFMKKVGFGEASGGKNGSITSLKEQMKRLFTCSIACVKEDSDNHFESQTFSPIHKANLWWDTKDPNQTSLFMSSITLGSEFYNEVLSRPVVFRLATLKLLKKSPLAIDMYIWITYKNSYAKKPSWIKWQYLQKQFGVGYPDTVQGQRDFKKMFIKTLKKVAIAYPEANKLKPEKDNLIFVPGKPDIPKLAVLK